MEFIIGNKYKLLNKIGEGSFGKIFMGINQNTNEKVAVKIENNSELALLRHESHMYTKLRYIDGIPNIRAYGKEGKYNYLVTDYLGESLEDILIKCKGTLKLKVVLDIGIQLIKIIELVHNANIIHRDIKPENILFGLKPNHNKLYLIDFGLSKFYIKDKKHIDIKCNRDLIGTPRYISINIHEGYSPSRRDDMESIGYILLYLLIEKLPWQGLIYEKEKQKQKHKQICIIKKMVKLWEYKSIPGEIIIFINYCKNMKYEEKPDYNYLKELLLNLYKHKEHK